MWATVLPGDAQCLPRKDQIGVENLIPVGLEDARPLGRVAVDVLRDGRERVTRDNLTLGEPVIRVDQGATEDDRHDDLADLDALPPRGAKDLHRALRRRDGAEREDE